MIYLIPFIISFCLGSLIIRTALKNKTSPSLFLCFLALAIGLGVSGFITFTSFILFNQLIPWFVITLNLVSIAALCFILRKNRQLHPMIFLPTLSRSEGIAILVIMLTMLPVFFFTQLYPYGGWDAWSCWNTKARFLFLGGTSWSNMFDPAAWRIQILYPFLLPLINVWVWCFGTTATYAVPAAMTCVIPFLVAGLLYSAIKELTGKSYALIAPVWLLTNWFIVQLSASQYSDLLLGLLLLSSVLLFLYFKRTGNPGYLSLMGLTIGLMSFTKVEGTALGTLTFLAAFALIQQDSNLRASRKSGIGNLFLTSLLAAIPLIIFAAFYAPRQSGIFINGLTSAEHPVTIERIGLIFHYYAMEFLSPKWNGTWIVLLIGLLLGGRQTFRKELLILPLILGGYFIIFTGSYAVNTFYEIIWWLDTSLNRVIFAVMPTVILWTFLSLRTTAAATNTKTS